jgi:hypothetical protein
MRRIESMDQMMDEAHRARGRPMLRKPTCPAAEMVATGMLEEIEQAPFNS